MLIKRDVTQRVRDHLSSPEISLIVGPRQAGKTTLMKEIRTELSDRGERTVWFNLDFEEDRALFVSQRDLLRAVKYHIGDSGYVFIDEIQRKEDAGLFLKGLYDRETKYKWIVSGSGSLELKEKIGESLAGRKRVFELTTVTMAEFVSWKEEEKEDSRLLWKIYPELWDEYYQEYIQFGGYPKVILANTIEEKLSNIKEIYQSYLEKDLIQLLKIEKSESLTNLIRLLSNNLGQLVNYHDLSTKLGISVPTVKRYLWYLEKTFLVYRVSPYFANKGKEITKSPIYYFADLGMANYANGQFGAKNQFGLKGSAGFLTQNYVYLQLLQRFAGTVSTINYWRTQDGAEVDFVVNTGQDLIPFEVKNSNLKKREITRSFRSFLTKYSPRVGYIVSHSNLPDLQLDSTTVKFVCMGEII